MITSAQPGPTPQSISSSFSRHVVWTFGTRLVMILNSVASGIIVAHWLGVEGFGKLAVINVSVTTLVQMGSLGLPSANTYFIAKDPNHLRRAALNSLLFALIVGGVLAVALAVLAQVRPAWFGFVSPELFRVAAISIPFQLLTLIGLNIFLAMGNVREFNLLDLLGQSFVLINAFVALIVLQASLGTLVTLNSVTAAFLGLVIVALLTVSARKHSGSADVWRCDFALLGQMMKYGIKSHLSIVAGALIFRADLLVVNHFRGAAEAGVYGVASQMATMLMLLPAVIATLLFPRVTAEQDETGKSTSLVARHTAFIMLLCCLAAGPLSLLLPVFYGDSFSDSSMQLMILLPGVYLVGLQSVLVQHFNAIGLPKTVPLFWIVTLFINIVLVFVLVPRFGARGAATASTISYSLISVLVTSYFLWSTRRSLADVFVVRWSELRTMLNFGRA